MIRGDITTMDILKIFTSVILGFLYLNIGPTKAQWGLQWGWLPGSLGKVRPIRLIGNLKTGKHGRVLWRPLKNDLILERDSSDSSDSSDEYKKKFIKKLKRRLSKRKRTSLRRKSANALIEKFVKDKILRNKKVNRFKNSTNNKKRLLIHSKDKGSDKVKPIRKTSLVPRLRHRLLPDFDYGTTITPFKAQNVQKIRGKGASLIKDATKFGGGSIKRNKYDEHETEIDDEPTGNTNGGSYTTEQTEFEESSHNTTSGTKQTTEGQEVETEDATQKSSSKYTTEGEIEAEETTTAGYKKSTAQTSSKTTSSERETEAEEVTTVTALSGTGIKNNSHDHEIEVEQTTGLSTLTTTLRISTAKFVSKQQKSTNSGHYTNLSGINDGGLATPSMKLNVPPPPPKREPGSVAKIFPDTISTNNSGTKQTQKDFVDSPLPVHLGDIAPSSPIDSIRATNVVGKTQDSYKDKLGSGRRRVDDNGKTTLKPTETNKRKEILTFSGRVINSRIPESAHEVISTKNEIINIQSSTHKLSASITNKDTGVINPQRSSLMPTSGMVNVQNTPINRSIMFQRHGITILKPTNSIIRKNEKVLSESPVKRTINIAKVGASHITKTTSKMHPSAVKQVMLGSKGLRQGSNQFKKVTKSESIDKAIDLKLTKGVNNGVNGRRNVISAGNGIGGKDIAKNNVVGISKGMQDNIAVNENRPILQGNKPFVSKKSVSSGTFGIDEPRNPENYTTIDNSAQLKKSADSKAEIAWQHRVTSPPVYWQQSENRKKQAVQTSDAIKNRNRVIGKTEKTDISWGPVATSNPMSPTRSGSVQTDTMKWGHKATSKPVYRTKAPSLKAPNSQSISWGPRATSGPVENQRFSTETPFKQTISNLVYKNDISSNNQPTRQIKTSPSGGLFDQLRAPTTRNLGSNRGRLTISDAGNSSRLMPLSNGHVKSKIQKKIQADETMTKKWIETKQRQAVDIATELEGTWKGSSLGTRKQNVNKFVKIRGMEQKSPTEKDPITFRWSHTWI